MQYRTPSPKSIAIIAGCLLLFVAARLKRAGMFAPRDEVVELTYNAHLRKTSKDEHYALYHPALNAPASEAIFDGTYRTLDSATLKGSDEIFMLDASGERYLLDARTGNCELMLDGNPFERCIRDPAGGLCFETRKGLYFLSDTPGTPSPVERYLRSAGAHDAFIYRRDGKWGVYVRVVRLVKFETQTFQSRREYRYVEILPAEFDRIRFVSGDGAFHFVARKEGKWQLYDCWGRRRRMCAPSYYSSEHRMNEYSPTGAGEGEMTDSYVRNIAAIDADCQEEYIPYLRTRCTYTGDPEAGIIRLATSEEKYDRFFSPDGDLSNTPLSWDDPQISNQYGYGIIEE